MKRRWKSLAAVMLGICILAGMAVDVWADDGSEKGYTYNYDYWEIFRIHRMLIEQLVCIHL